MVPEVDGMTIVGSPRLARKTARPLQEPPQEVWRCRSCGYVKFHLGGLNLPERKRYLRSKRDDAQRCFRDCAASRCGRLGKRQLYVGVEPTGPPLPLTVCIQTGMRGHCTLQLSLYPPSTITPNTLRGVGRGRGDSTLLR